MSTLTREQLRRELKEKRIARNFAESLVSTLVNVFGVNEEKKK